MRFLSHVALFIFGVIVGLLVTKVPGLRIKPEANIAEIGNFGLGLIIALVLPLVVNRAIESRRRRGDIVADHIKAVRAGVASIHERFAATDTAPMDIGQTRLIVANIKELSTTLTLVKRGLARWGFRSTALDVLDRTTTALRSYKKAVTNRIPAKSFRPTTLEMMEESATYINLITSLEDLMDELQS